MLGISLEESRVYQDAKVEGRIEEVLSIVTRQLNRKLGKLPTTTIPKIKELSLEQLEELTDALLDFSSVTDLQTWLQNRPTQP